MADTKQTRSNQVCIRCGNSDRVIQRGLCQAHYGEYRTAKSHVDKSELEIWEASLVAKGLLLPDARKASNPYIDTLAELRAQTGSQPASEMPDVSDPTEGEKLPDALDHAKNSAQARSGNKRSKQITKPIEADSKAKTTKRKSG